MSISKVVKFMNSNFAQAADTVVSLSSNSSATTLDNVVNDNRGDYWEVGSGSTTQWVKLDLLSSGFDVGFVALIGPHGNPFDLSATGTVKIQANSVDSWASPAVDTTLTVTDEGLFYFFDTKQNYRFWRFYMEDTSASFQIDASRYARFSHLYVGDYLAIDQSNISVGFQEVSEDFSTITNSITGRRFANVRAPVKRYDSMAMNLIPAAERRVLRSFNDEFGRHKPFFCSIDPTAGISSDISEFTRLVFFEGQMTFGHVIRDYFSCNFSLKEAV